MEEDLFLSLEKLINNLIVSQQIPNSLATFPSTDGFMTSTILFSNKYPRALKDGSNKDAIYLLVCSVDKKSKLSPQKEVETVLWNQVYVTTAQEHRFKLLQTLCSSVVTVS